MPTLNRWFTTHYARLMDEGKAPLAETFEAMRSAFFDENVPQVERILPRVYQLSDAFGEPEWRLAADYYAILYEMIWRGKLARGLELATQAVLRMQRVVQVDSPLGWYLQLLLFDAWLSSDGEGYAADILKAVDALDGDGLPEDIKARVDMVRVFAEVQADPTCGEAALQTILGILPMLASWERAYCMRLRGLGLTWAGRFDEAAQDFDLAVAEFEQMGHRIAANDSRLSMGEALMQAGRIDESMDVLRATLSAAERLPNRAQLGVTQGAIGRALIRQGLLEDGTAWISAALGALDGLGWLSTEAELAVSRVYASYGGGLSSFPADLGDAMRRAERLRSTSVRLALNALVENNTGSL